MRATCLLVVFLAGPVALAAEPAKPAGGPGLVDEKLVLAHQVFKENESVRHVTVITKTSIIERYNMKIDDKCDEVVIEDLEIEE